MKSKHPGLVQLGKNLRHYRREAKLSQEELAEKAGLDQTYITSVERGHRNISAINIMRLVKALDIDYNSLFPDTRSLL